MRGKRSCMALSAAFALSLAVMTGVAHAGAKPLPANANEYGKGYAGLTAEWLEWTVAVPAPTNPILDLDGTFAAEGQSGKVWFLTGTLGGPATRAVTIPAGTSLFFPIVNYFWVNTPEYGDAAWSPDQEAFVRELMAETIDTAQNVSLGSTGGRFKISIAFGCRALSERVRCLTTTSLGSPSTPCLMTVLRTAIGRCCHRCRSALTRFTSPAGSHPDFRWT